MRQWGLVQHRPPRFTFVAGRGGAGSNWPYPRLWQRLPGWIDLWVEQEYQPEPVLANPLGRARRVMVKRGLLNPAAARDCQAIVLSMSLYAKHRQEWPTGAKILLLAPSDQEGQLPTHDDRIVFVGSKRAPLGDLLDSLAKICDQLAINRVSSVGIGYEDEGAGLDVWRRQAGPALEADDLLRA